MADSLRGGVSNSVKWIKGVPKPRFAGTSNGHRTCQGEPAGPSLQLLPIISISWIMVFISFQILLAWECSNICSSRFHKRWTSSWQKRLLRFGVLGFFSSQNSCFKRGLALKDNYKNDKLASVFGCLLNNFSTYLLMTPKAHLEHWQLRLCQERCSHALPRVAQKLKTLAVPLKCTCIIANSTEDA